MDTRLFYSAGLNRDVVRCAPPLADTDPGVRLLAARAFHLHSETQLAHSIGLVRGG